MSVLRPHLRATLADLSERRPESLTSTPTDTSHPLANNESPFAPLPSVAEAMAAAVGRVNRYPDAAAGGLANDIAAWLRVGSDQVVVGCGSVGVLQLLFEMVGEPGAEALYAWRSFEAYPMLAELAGLKAVAVPLRGERHDLPGMAAAITPRTRLIVVCNPNSPTGTTVKRAELEDFLDAVPDGCLVVLDEAYREYVRDTDSPDGLRLQRGRPDVVVVRTFSKAFGLAGLRVGYLVADPAIAAGVRMLRLPYCVNQLAQVAASASLRAQDELTARVERTVRERDRVRSALLGVGWPVPPSETNFLWLGLGEESAGFAEVCAAHDVNVRIFPGDGVRVTIGERKANDVFLAAAEEYRRSR
ncbi:aminotransferase [Planomonospora sphaerica]|uniref:Aminotransferase n=1 Tax=Planomonospora sphaerica TaxID=161355 RepID=A0A171DKE4_9ACTN|nr:histidinol-phosphate transaminase [Planomonospora sphaerica]GAT69297.1 aminotransferase [Planomonospora sphaerica]